MAYPGVLVLGIRLVHELNDDLVEGIGTRGLHEVVGRLHDDVPVVGHPGQDVGAHVVKRVPLNGARDAGLEARA